MNVKSRKITIYDISKKAGVSPSTVSAVLNGNWKKRRIAKKTVEQVEKLAQELRYSVNLQARGLRQSSSGLVGLLLPIHDSRYFASLAQKFNEILRKEGKIPIVISTERQEEDEVSSINALIRYSVDGLLVAGSSHGEIINQICTETQTPHVFIDLPGYGAPSVISDNRESAQKLTTAIFEHGQKAGILKAQNTFFLGGLDDEATRARLAGFMDIYAKYFGSPHMAKWPFYELTGYNQHNTAVALQKYYEQHGDLPQVMFINSSTNLEGLLQFLEKFPSSAFKDHVIGCFDYDPFASFLPLPVYCIRQNTEAMIKEAFAILDQKEQGGFIKEVPAMLIAPRNFK